MKLFLVFFVFLEFVFGENPRYEYISPDSIPELKYLDNSVDPCDNFYQYTCGNFKNVHPMPEGNYNWDHFVILQKEILGLMGTILETPRKSDEPIALQKAKAAYTSCINTEYTDLLKMPQQTVMEEMGVWPVLSPDYYDEEPIDLGEIGRVVAKYGVPLIFNYEVLPNYYSAKDNVIHIYKDALSNPQTYYPRFEIDLENYLQNPPLSKSLYNDENITPFEQFVRMIAFRLRDFQGAKATDEKMKRDIAETIDFMVKLQGGGIPLTGLPKSITVITVKQLQEWTDEQFGANSVNWKVYLNNLFSATGLEIEDSMKVMHTPYLTYGVLNLFLQTEHRVLRNFIMVRLFTYMAPDSDKFMREAFDTYYQQQNYDVFSRSEYCVRKIAGYPNRIDYSMALTYEYQRYHFNINKLSSAADMVQDLMESFRDMLEEASWIDQETREHALSKLEYMYTLLGYPEYAEDPDSLDEYYDELRVCTWEHFGNSQRTRSFGQMKNFELIGKERDRENWSISPLEVNAFYNRATNRILFPVSVLNSIFFSGNISTLDYGRIGAIIGHEITHGYDMDGRIYDKEGLWSKWWTQDTEAAFTEKTQCFLDQYGKYYIEEIGQYVNSSQTLNENIADNGGLRQAYKALQKLQEKVPSIKTLENFTPEQLFFIGYGTMWCMTETEYYLEQMHQKNVYSPGRFRVIGAVSNMPEFAEAFSCPIGSNMNPKEKCVLW